MKLNIYLYKQDIQDFTECLRPVTRNRQYKQVETTIPLQNGEYQIYVLQGEPKKPKWLNFIKDHVNEEEVSELANRTCSMVILLKLAISEESNRIFGISHGFGFHLIDKHKIEPNFGLITTLNCINSKRIKSIDTRSLGVQTLQKREASNLYTNLGEFAFEFDAEILQVISGACEDLTIGTKMSGSDSLNLTTSLAFDNLPQKCRIVYEKFSLEDYKTHFEFVDYIKHEKDVDIIDTLDQALLESINNRRMDLTLSMAYPDQIEYERSGHFKFYGLRRSRNSDHDEVTDEFSDITLESLYQYLGEQAVDLQDLRRGIRIIGIDASSDEPCTTAEPLYSYLVFEVDVENKKYIFSNKKWYYIEGNYLARLESDLNTYVHELSDPTLKDWSSTLREEKYYNALYQSENEYLCLDRDSFIGEGFSYSKIEVADIFHEPTRKLFFVKKLNKSATLSHLFSQATVSANLFKENTEYRQYFISKLREKWIEKDFDESYIENLNIVYVIATNKAGDILNILPIFSKINLLKHLKFLRKLGFPVEVSKVQIVN